MASCAARKAGWLCQNGAPNTRRRKIRHEYASCDPTADNTPRVERQQGVPPRGATYKGVKNCKVCVPWREQHPPR